MTKGCTWWLPSKRCAKFMPIHFHLVLEITFLISCFTWWRNRGGNSLSSVATVEPKRSSTLVVCSSSYLSFLVILWWRSFIIFHSSTSISRHFLDVPLRSVLVSDFWCVTTSTFFDFSKGLSRSSCPPHRNCFLAKNQDDLNPLLLPLLLNRLKIGHYFLTLSDVWILRSTWKSYIFQNLAITFLMQQFKYWIYLLFSRCFFFFLSIVFLGFQTCFPLGCLKIKLKLSVC